MTLSNDDRLNELFEKYIDKTITDEERAELFVYIRNPETKDRVLSFMDEHNKKVQPTLPTSNVDWDTMYANITSQGKMSRSNGFKSLVYLVAAVMLLVVGFALYTNQFKENRKSEVLVYNNDILPEEGSPVLTLADGSKINLTSGVKGKLAVESGIAIERDAQGQIVYKVNHIDVGDDEKINTLSTPVGTTFSVILSDGSKVWLNASSSIRFPAKFIGSERRVEIVGEAYFEIAKDKKHPFFVKNGSAEVKVLGTHFNMMAYADEYRSALTLVEGSVQFTKNQNTQLLKPGKQILYEEASSVTKQVDANIEEVLAWRNNLFVFNNTSLDEIMKDLTRWYNMKVKYEGDKPEVFFTGVIPRNESVSKVLKTLELTGDVVFGIQDNVITCKRK